MAGPSADKYNCTAESVSTSSSLPTPKVQQATSQGQVQKPTVKGKPSTTASSNSAPSCSKDPSRPRRKKAKRACYACQRAHLTCGDERPCQRCVKRGLQDQCQDGVRKKAKYLHDAPNEALVPGVQRAANLYSQSSAANTPLNQSSASESAPPLLPQSTMGYSNVYGPKAKHQQANVTASSLPEDVSSGLNARSPVSPTFTLPSSASGTTATRPTSTAATLNGVADSDFNSAFFDPSHPALFNFDIASINFDSHYGAMEFGMLAHMTGTGNDSLDNGTAMSTSNSVSTPRPNSTSTTITTNPARLVDADNGKTASTCTGPSLNSPNDSNMPYALFNGTSSLHAVGEWSATSNLADNMAVGDTMGYRYATPAQIVPQAFVIGSTRSPSQASGSPDPDTETFNEVGGDSVDSASGLPTYVKDSEHEDSKVQGPWPQPAQTRSSGRVQKQGVSRKRRRSPDELYKSVKKPYSYTNGFHTLTAYIHRRFSPSKTLQIAKALASIRPSLIATNKTLDAADLIFMEKCFQRTLWEYEDFINVVSTPTIICRRTGEVAAVGKEFCMLTGWKKEVLLGLEPNENVNIGGGNGRKATRGDRSSRDMNPASQVIEANRPRPVLLAELLDDESVIEFYDDFAKLAFGDSRGSIMTTCKLLKYQTKDGAKAEMSHNDGRTTETHPRWTKTGIAGRQGMDRLGAADGKVECSYCWTVKRDVFDIPMLIVMN
ncbi:hypothetical protein KEM56_004774, partial [Ascosphaera pollenicola]